jgi:hypothetical protein
LCRNGEIEESVKILLHPSERIPLEVAPVVDVDEATGMIRARDV